MAAYDGERRAEVVRDDRDEVRPRPLELAEALGRLALEGIERRLVDRERRLVRESTDEPHLLLEELLVVGNLQHHGAEKTVVRDERHRDVVEGHDRTALGERALRGSASTFAELAAARPLADGVAFFAEKDGAGSSGVNAHKAVDHQREHLVEVQGRREDVRDLEERGDLAELAVRLALEPPFLDDPGDLIRDRLQEIDLFASEVALLDRLHVHDADDLISGEDGDREHRGEALLVDLRHPLPAGLAPNVTRRKRNAGVRDPANDSLAHPQRGASDPPAVEPVRGDEAQYAVGPLEEIQR